MLFFAAACAHRPAGEIPPPRPAEEAPAPEAPRVEVGLASYYARHFEGRRTASGARYHRKSMTCAHPSHPFGSWLKVTNMGTGRSVVVEVIDRGPFRRGRVVDLSWAAAQALGIVGQGVAKVRVERVR